MNSTLLAISGCITALATPFDADGAVDFAAWRQLLAMQLEGGVQALVVAGSTGEAAALGDDEYEELLRQALAVVAGRVPVLAGTGHSATARTIAQTRRAAELGADAALVVTPPYVRPTQAGLIAHYRAVAAEGGLPVLLYNVPTRTGCDLQPEAVAELATQAGIIGLKEAVADPARIAALAALSRPGFALLSGDDPSARRAMQAGFDGVVSVASNVAPRALRRLCDLARDPRQAAAAEALDARLQPLFEFLGCEPNPIPVKALLRQAGIGHGLRLPLTALSPMAQTRLQVAAAVILELENECH
ncbi:4-hydroxy-tetrahydrodipicolinate synthase [Luteimonas sp. e5]